MRHVRKKRATLPRAILSGTWRVWLAHSWVYLCEKCLKVERHFITKLKWKSACNIRENVHVNTAFCNDVTEDTRDQDIKRSLFIDSHFTSDDFSATNSLPQEKHFYWYKCSLLSLSHCLSFTPVVNVGQANAINSQTSVNLSFWFIRNIILKKFTIWVYKSLSPPYNSKGFKQLKLLICSTVLSWLHVLLITVSVPPRTIMFVFEVLISAKKLCSQDLRFSQRWSWIVLSPGVLTSCSPLKVNLCFGGTYRLHFQGWVNWAWY
jgi:hypothetical protein